LPFICRDWTACSGPTIFPTALAKRVWRCRQREHDKRLFWTNDRTVRPDKKALRLFRNLKTMDFWELTDKPISIESVSGE
jgi:hypothetical protein